MENSKVRIAYFVHGLSGGVGSVLINYIDMLPKSRYEFDVITLYIESDDLYRKFTSRGINVIKIPICAAAPRIKLFGFAINGPKSVIAPIPRKISGG